MGFTFAEKPQIEIDGAHYECDPTNQDLIEGVFNDFPRIVAAGQTIDRLQQELKAAIAARDTTRIETAAREVIAENTQLLEHCRVFIQGCLGREEYAAIFKGRKPNSAEHLELCTYIFEQIIEGRQKVLEAYLDPPAPCC